MSVKPPAAPAPKQAGKMAAPYAATAEVKPNTGPVCSALNKADICLKVDPLLLPVEENKSRKEMRKGKK